MIKRIIDLFGAAGGLLVCLPVMAVAAVLIKLDSRGPVLFRQVRMGRGLRAFWIYKFRTMVDKAERSGGQLTVNGDPRITRVGKVLREYKIDELPQLVNVLIGDMSLVGPRPEVPRYVEQFRDAYERILTVRPGLTDLASLQYLHEEAHLGSGESSEETYVREILPDKIRLANLYLEQRSLWLDLAILAQTLANVLGLRWTLVALDVSEKDARRRPPERRSMARLKAALFKWRRPIIVGLDVCLVILASYLAFWLRFDGQIPAAYYALFLETLPWLIVVRTAALYVFRLHEGLWRYTSLWDVKKIVTAVLASTILFYVFVEWAARLSEYPRSIYVIDSMLLIGFLVGIRLPARLIRQGLVLRRKRRVLIFGAGDRGERIVREMRAGPSMRYEPIGFVDDDPGLQGRRIHGIKVLGTGRDLARLVRTEKVEEVLLALPHTAPEMIRGIISSLGNAKVSIKTLPSLTDFFNGKSAVSQIRSLALEDLLARAPIAGNTGLIRDMLKGKRVLVTGAGGSIGSELCRQVVSFEPEALILFERHENSLYTIMRELQDHEKGSLTHAVIGDVVDAPRVQDIMERYRPHIVLHAAAHKHVPLMEVNPGEAYKNNCMGTRVVAQTADRYGVERFVLVSTDKAVNPASVMGATKRVAELIVRDMAARSGTRFLTVRFGNVLGSNGSVVPLFQDQISAGGPVTVTHPEVRRYFMLIREAVHLILQAAALGEQGAIYVLDMGEQIRVVDLARNLIRLSGFVPDDEIHLVFTGLRPGEKLTEELVATGERAESSGTDKILRIQNNARPNFLHFNAMIRACEEAAVLGQADRLAASLKALVPTLQIGAIAGVGAPDSRSPEALEAPAQRRRMAL